MKNTKCTKLLAVDGEVKKTNAVFKTENTKLEPI